MKWSPILHNAAVVIIAAGVLALLGAWWTQLTGRPLWGMSQQHLFSDTTVLILLGMAFQVGTMLHRDIERHGK